jgi:hypothetical protein
LAYATGSTGLALTVRGSSRRIMIMRFRPANIRLINRRQKLLRLLLALCSWRGDDNHKTPTNHGLTRSLHIRPIHSSTTDARSDYECNKDLQYNNLQGTDGTLNPCKEPLGILNVPQLFPHFFLIER